MAISKWQLKANSNFRKKHLYTITINYHKKYDSAVVCKLQSTENKTDYIRQLILKDIGGK